MVPALIFDCLRDGKSRARCIAYLQGQPPDSGPPSIRIHRSNKLFIAILIGAHLSLLPAQAQSWEQSKREDAREGKTYLQFVLRGKYLVPPSHPDSEEPRLVVFCGGGKFTRGQFLPGMVA